MEIGRSVPFVYVNVNKCLCPRCPVQTSSKCVMTKVAEIKDTIIKYPLSREDIPGVYCATGSATCTDIYTARECMCGKCVVFPEYKLFDFSPMGHYCKNGVPK